MNLGRVARRHAPENETIHLNPKADTHIQIYLFMFIKYNKLNRIKKTFNFRIPYVYVFLYYVQFSLNLSYKS